jgi:toxin ParE1/3/4
LKVAQLSEPAEGDLADIWVEIARDQIENADRFIEQLKERMQQLADQPLIGRERPEIAKHIRSFPHGEYLVLYRPSATGVDIARVLHGRRDLSRIEIPST